MSYPRKNGQSLPVRLLAGALIPILLWYLGGAGELAAQTYREFNQSRDRVDTYVDRATRLADEAAWSNYVELGVATERVAWEQEAYETLTGEIEAIEASEKTEEVKAAEIAAAKAEFEDAAEDWEDEAQTFVEQERGEFRARTEAATIDIADVADATYIEIIARAEAAVADTAAVDLDGWEAAIAGDLAALETNFESELAGELARVRGAVGALTGAELAAFEDTLTEVEADLRREFEVRDNFFIARARNRYVALKRGDELSAKLDADATSAESMTDAIVADTLAALDKDTSDLLEAARTEMANLTADPDDPDFSAAGLAWEQRMEAVIDAGLRAWERSEEDLYKRRLDWMQQAQTNQQEGARIWEENHEALKKARDEWIVELETQINEGRRQWEDKIAEFRDNREQAEQELADYIVTERERREAVSKELGGIINGGGTALLEAKDAYRYYNSLIEALQPPGGGAPAENRELYDFYVQQRDIMSRAVGSYQTILAGSENVLYASMHSPEDHTGFLEDVRLFAGDLKDDVLGLDAADFETELKALIAAKGEDFTLYKRDIEDLITQNGLFHERAEELAASSDFDYNAAADRGALDLLVAGLDRKYDEHREEIEERLADRETAFAAANDTSAVDYDANLLAALKTELTAWLATATDRDEHLKQVATRYFNEGLGGYYLTGNEGDPYYMSQAEYQWELLRRERNYLAKELERAEAVKAYADLAFTYEAGIEMAAVTRERTEIAKVKQDIKEISYMLLQGNLTVDPAAATDDAVRDAEFQRILSERGVDVAALLARKGTLQQERDLVDAIRAFAAAPTAGEVDTLRANLDTYLDTAFGTDPDDEDRLAHPFAAMRGKLVTFASAIAGGTDAATLEDQWTTLRGGADAVGDLLDQLYDEYTFDELAGELDDMRLVQMRMPTIGELQDDMAEITSRIEANAELLATSKDRLEQAKEAYRQARLDFDIIRAGNSEDLIRNDVINNTAALAGVIQRMQTIESSVPLFGGQNMDALGASRAGFSAEVSERERADNDATVAGRALVLVEGLSLARERVAALDGILSGTAGKTAAEVADLFLAAEADLVKSDATDAQESQNSEDNAQQAFAQIETGKQALEDLNNALTTAIADGESAAEIEYIRTQIAVTEENILRMAETFTAAVRGEATARSEHLLYYLERLDGGSPAFDADEVLAELTEDLADQSAAAQALAVSAAERLSTWLGDNHKDGADYRSYDQLLARINTQIGTRDMQDTAGYGSAGATFTAAEQDRAELLMIRDYLLANRATLEAAGVEAGSAEAEDLGLTDNRTVADKWNSVLAAADTIADSHDTYATFEASIPGDVNDAWAVAYRTERESLRDDLTTLLGSSDAALAGNLSALPADTRELLLEHGGWREGDLRNSIEASLARVEQTLAALTTLSGVQAAYRQDRARSTMEEMAALEPDLARDAAELGRLQTARGEALLLRDRLQEKLDADASRTAELQPQIDAAEAEISALDAGIAPLLADLETRQLDYARLSAVAGEAQQPGSSLSFFQSSQSQMHGANQSMATGLWLLGLVENDKQDKDDTADFPVQTEELLGVIGYYQTDRVGDILRDGDGNALIDETFLGGAIDPALDIFEQIGGDMRGEDLVAMATAINDALNDETRRQRLSVEVQAAAGLLEDALRQTIVAETLIDMRDRTAADIETEGRTLKDQSRDSLSKLNQVLALQDSLNSALGQAEANGADPITAALGVLESPEALRTLRLFSGYDASGEPDGVADAQAQAKLDELKKLTAQLRELRIQSTVQQIAGDYAAQLNAFVASSENPYAYAPNRDDFLAAQPTLDTDAVRTELDAIPGGDGYRSRVETWLGDATTSQTLHAGTLYDLLATSASEGDTLKAEVDAAISALELRLSDELAPYLDAARHDADRDANLEVTTSVENLIAAYATRGSDAVSELQPVIDGLAELTSIVDSRITVETKLSELEAEAESSALTGILREVRRITNAAPDTLRLKTDLTTYLSGLSDPAAPELDTLTEELHARELTRSLAQMSASATYDADDYPAELRETVLLYSYQQAAGRYDDYQTARASDVPAIRDGATFNLTGINGQIANHILLNDFTAWQTTNPFADYMTNATAPSIDGYLNAYYTDRNTAPGYLPDGAQALRETIALSERHRLETEITSAGIQNVNAADYPADFRAHILLRKFQDHATTAGLTLTGGDADTIMANYERDFDAFLSTTGLGTSLLTTGTRDRLFVNAYQHLSVPYDADQILPDALLTRYINGTLDDPFTSDLPADLTAITDYATADYRAQAAAVSDTTAAALARIETAHAALSVPLDLTMTDAELSAIVTRAGYDTASAALQTELKTYIQQLALGQNYGGAGSVNAAMATLRQTNALNALLPTTADRQALTLFTTAQGETLSSIEEKYYTALEDADARIQQLATENRGQVLSMLTTGAGHPLYAAQPPEVQTAINQLRDDLYGPSGTLTTEEQTALTTQPAEYEQYFQVRAAQEQSLTGLITGAEQALDAVVIRSGTAVQQQAIRDNGPEATRAIIESIYAEAGIIGSISPTSATYISTHNLTDAITKTMAEMNPELKNALLDQPVVVQRVLDTYMETAADRATITAIFNDPAALDYNANLSMDYELAKAGALLNQDTARLTAALRNTVDDHRRSFETLDRQYKRDGVIGEELITFAQARGDDMLTSRFSSYRTYLGVDEAYVPGTVADRQTAGTYLEHTSMGLDNAETILDAGTYKDLITSDSNAAGTTVTMGGGTTYETRGIKTVSSINAHSWGDNHAGAMRHTYHENLANNYLESISNLNNTLNNLWNTAKLAENREAEEKTFLNEVANAYDTGDLDATKTAITALKVDAESRRAEHSDAKISEKQEAIGGVKTTMEEAARDFAGAGRRNQLRNMALTAYLDQVYRGIATEMDAAEREYNALSANAETLRAEFTTKNQQYAGALEDLAQRSRELAEASDQHNKRARVQEYAETPYLYAKSEDGAGGEPDSEILTEWRGDAEEEYERAQAALDQAQDRLNQASYEVQTEDRLPEFNNVVALWEAGGRVDLAPLTTDEQTRLAELRDRKYNSYEELSLADANELLQLEERDLFERNKELIETRAEHIKHTMRLVRIAKAKELIEAEITRRRMIAQEKEQQFKRELSARFKVNESNEEGVESRNAVYARMAMLVETGGSFYNEFKSWYWGSRDYISDFAGQNASTALGSLFATTALTITMNQILEGISGQWMAGSKNAADKTMIGRWMHHGGSIAEFGGFKQLYFQFVLSIGIWDQKRLEYEITRATWDPVASQGQSLIDRGNRMKWGGGGILVNIGKGMKGQANSEVMRALLQYKIAEHIMRRQYNGANKMADKAKSNTIKVMEAQSEYEDALAELYYFTRVPDAKTLKERMIQYGAQNAYEQAGPGDTTTGALYALTEDDLAYMFDDTSGYVDSAGNTYDPADRDVDEAEMLNVEGLKYDVEYRDAFGRRYDPNRVSGGQPGGLEGGWYKGPDGNYTRIKISNHNRSKEYRYAHDLADDAPMHSVYDMGTVLDSAMAHAENLREDRRAKYIAAGNAVSATNGDQHFTFSERDKTYGDLFNQAAAYNDGGREFTGYRLTYNDYNGNSMEVQANELQQRQGVQLKEWELKETELITQYENWEKRIQTIMQRGRREWGKAEGQFLQKWRQWDRDTDQNIAAAQKEWDDKIKEHFTKKQEWETKTRSEAGAATIEKVLGDAVDSLNAQLMAAGVNAGGDFDTINKTAAINEAIAEMNRDLPSGREKLKQINSNIKNFNTTLSIAEMIGANVDEDAIDVTGRFRSQMEEHQKNMKVLANVQIFEQYRQLIEEFKYSITVQNEEIQTQTEAAAYAEGYQKVGDTFVKQGDASDAYGIVNAYKWFDVDKAMNDQLSAAGFTELRGNDLVSFLDNRSTTEVEAYFYTQKLAVQTAIGNIQGHGSSEERTWATDSHTLGLFGAWVGRAKNSMGDSSGLPMESLAHRAAGNSGDSNNNANIIAAAGAGFGELGAFSQRPGGAPLGFYPQLGVMSRYVQKIDNEWMANGKAFRRSQNFETPDDLKGDAFDQLGERMDEMDELNDAFARNDGDMVKMWKQGYLDAYDVGPMKYGDFQAQQTALYQKYNYQPPLSQQAKFMQQAQAYAQKVGEYTQRMTEVQMRVATRSIGAITRVATNPTDPSAWVGMLSAQAQSMGEAANLMGESIANLAGDDSVTHLTNNTFGVVSEAMDGIGEGLAHAAMELELSNDPISSLLRQFDPVRMTRNSVMNAELAAQVHGKGRGYMYEAQLINAVKQPLAIAGSMLVAAGVGAGSTGVGSVPGAIVAAIGAAVVTLANSTHVDVKTGERGVKLTDQAALQSAIAILGAAIGGAAIGSGQAAAGEAAGKVAEMSFVDALGAELAWQATQQSTTQLAFNTASGAGMEFLNFHADGSLHGLKTGKDLDAATIRAVAGMGSSLLGGKITKGLGVGGGAAGSLVGNMVGAGFGALGEDLIGRTVGWSHSRNEAARRTDLSSGLGMLGSAGMAQLQAALAQRGQRALIDAGKAGRSSSDKQQQQAFIDLLNGLGYRREEDMNRVLAAVDAEIATEKFRNKTLGTKEATDLLNNIRRANKTGFGGWNDDWDLISALEKANGGPVTMGDILDLAGGQGLNIDFKSAEFKTAAGNLAHEEKWQEINKVLEKRPDLRWDDKNQKFVRRAVNRGATGAWGRGGEGSWTPNDPRQMNQAERDAQPWYKFANTRKVLGDQVLRNGTANQSFGEFFKGALKGIFTPTDSQKRDFSEFYSGVLRDFGAGVSTDQVKENFFDPGYSWVEFYGPDGEQINQTYGEFEQGDFSSGGASLAMLGIVTAIDKIPGVKPFRKWAGPKISSAYNTTKDKLGIHGWKKGGGGLLQPMDSKGKYTSWSPYDKAEDYVYRTGHSPAAHYVRGWLIGAAGDEGKLPPGTENVSLSKWQERGEKHYEYYSKAKDYLPYLWEYLSR